MKNLIIICFVLLSNSILAQNIYVKIDTRDSIVCDTTVCNINDLRENENRVLYHIYKTIPEKQYYTDLRFRYNPFTDEYVKGTTLKAHRTKMVSKKDLASRLRYSELALTIDFDWIESHSWFLLHWMGRSAEHIYIIDAKYTTQDSVRIREVYYVDSESEQD